MTRVDFELSVVGRSNGMVSIALMARLPSPFPQELMCVAIVQCSATVAEGLCRQLGSVLNTGKSLDVPVSPPDESDSHAA